MKQEYLQHISHIGADSNCKQALRYPFITVLYFKQAINMYVFSVRIYNYMCLMCKLLILYYNFSHTVQLIMYIITYLMHMVTNLCA